jgi:hypothetical protein
MSDVDREALLGLGEDAVVVFESLLSLRNTLRGAPKTILGRKEDLLDGGGSPCNTSESFRNCVKGVSILISWWPPRLFSLIFLDTGGRRAAGGVGLEDSELLRKRLRPIFSTDRVFREGRVMDAFAFDLPASDSLQGRW